MSFKDNSYEYKQHRKNTKCMGVPKCPICCKYSYLMTSVIYPPNISSPKEDEELIKVTLEALEKAGF